MNRAAGYLRCSTDHQYDSIEDQRHAIGDYANRQGLILTRWFEDEGKSGTSFEKRPGFLQMLRLVEQGKPEFEMILVYDIDRWGRPTDPDEANYWYFHFKKAGCPVLFINDSLSNEDSIGGRINKAIRQETASEESRKQSLRVRERSKLRAGEGRWVGGTAPFGYCRMLFDAAGNPIQKLGRGEHKFEKSHKVTLTLGDPAEVETVREMFNMKNQGHGLRAITGWLNRSGILSPRGGIWCTSVVDSILRNPIYRGELIYNRAAKGTWVRKEKKTHAITVRSRSEWIVVLDAVPCIISPQLFDDVNSKRGLLQTRGRPWMHSSFLLTGLMECQICGSRFHGQSRRNSSGKKYSYYVDSGFSTHGRGVCGRNLVRQDLVEDFVLKKITKLVLSKINLQTMERQVRARLHSRLEGKRLSISELDSKLAEINRKIQNLVDSVANGMDYRLTKDSLEALGRERERIVGRKYVIEGSRQPEWDESEIARSIVGNFDRIESVLKSADPLKIRETLKEVIHKITVNPRERRVSCSFFRYPIPQELCAKNACFSMPEGGIEPPRGVSPAGF